MVTNDSSFVSYKHKILTDICRLKWDEKLNEDNINKLIYGETKGPKAKFRCCIYKEREILRQRVKLACGQNQENKPNEENVVQVIDAACMECPISSYSVTDNCRFCLGRPCTKVCKFGALSPGEVRMHIDSGKCKECGKCAAVCPFNAIVHLERPCKKACSVNAINYDDDGLCVIDDSKCIYCGSCVHACPFGAIATKTYLIQIIEAIKSGKEVYAMCAPATEGQYGEDINFNDLKVALKKIGFKDLVEVGLGADMVAAYESLEWAECLKNNKKLTTSCCYSFKQILKKHFNELYNQNVSNVISPMCATSRLLKYLHKDCVTVFIGPCVAKKAEAQDKTVKDNADYVITYGEFASLLRSKDIELVHTEEYTQEASLFGKKFATSGGVASAVLECMKERGEDVTKIKYICSKSAKECIKTLSLLKVGKLDEQFIEGMACEDGCVGGPSKRMLEQEISAARDNLLKKSDDRKVIDNLKEYPVDKINMYVK